MPAVTIRNLPEATHRALKVRAAHHGRSTEAEMREILETAVRAQGRLLIGSLLSQRIGYWSWLHGSMTGRPAAANALISRDATANPHDAAVAAM